MCLSGKCSSAAPSAVSEPSKRCSISLAFSDWYDKIGKKIAYLSDRRNRNEEAYSEPVADGLSGVWAAANCRPGHGGGKRARPRARLRRRGKRLPQRKPPHPRSPWKGAKHRRERRCRNPLGRPHPAPAPEETPGQETEAEAPAPEPVETPEPAESSEPEPELTAEETVGGTCGENLTWELNLTTGVLTISGTGEMAHAWSDSSCPWKSYRSSITSVIIEDGVTSIGTLMFHSCHALTSVSIPNSVTIIESSAFNSCSALTSVAIPGSVVSIESSAFENCYDLASVTIEYGVTSIDYWAFQNCKSLTSIVIPGSVTNIGYQAVAHCESLASVLIPDSVTTIGFSAFFQCDSLTSVTVPPSVTDMGMSVFNSCDDLTDVTIEDGCDRHRRADVRQLRFPDQYYHSRKRNCHWK